MYNVCVYIYIYIYIYTCIYVYVVWCGVVCHGIRGSSISVSSIQHLHILLDHMYMYIYIYIYIHISLSLSLPIPPSCYCNAFVRFLVWCRARVRYDSHGQADARVPSSSCRKEDPNPQHACILKKWQDYGYRVTYSGNSVCSGNPIPHEDLR